MKQTTRFGQPYLTIRCFLFTPGRWSQAVLLLLAFTWSVATAADCVETTDGIASMHREQITLLNDAGKPLQIDVLVADDAAERAAGFQSVCPSVIDKTFILFRYDREIVGKFHMQNVHAPLDIAFFDGRGRLLSQGRMLTYTATSQPLYGPGRPFQFALEAVAGYFSENGVSRFPSQLVIK